MTAHRRQVSGVRPPDYPSRRGTGIPRKRYFRLCLLRDLMNFFREPELLFYTQVNGTGISVYLDRNATSVTRQVQL